MQATSSIDTGVGFPRGLTRYQWTVFLVVWAGWALDATDFGLYSLVLRPALTELLGGSPTLADIGRVGGILSMVGLLGWAFGGFMFGTIADYVGRVRTLAISILTYSVFTALQGFAHSPLELGIFRFLGGLGTGGEIIVGIPLVAEAFAATYRARVLGVMMTGGAFGSLIGGWVYGLVGPYGWRWVFFVGIAPALLLAFIRRGMVEPEHFEAVRARRRAARANQAKAGEDEREFLRFVPVQLFTRRNRYSTMVGLMFALGTLLAIWTTIIWLPTIQTVMLEKDGIVGAAAIPYVSRGIMLFGVGGIFGYASFGFIADAIGRRRAIILYSVGTLVLGLTIYLGLSHYDLYPYLLPIYGFFVLGVFSGHAVYLPELFPTHVRATAVSFCNGTGRIVTSTGPLVAGLLVGYFGGLTTPAAIMTGFAALSILAMFLGRETRDDPLPLFEVGAAGGRGG
ncbi:MAG TPA: MFS transporter [Xanthobacteraceae bacterium]|nr:MFS transporter [Xanthobacteraceae bacterium]